MPFERRVAMPRSCGDIRGSIGEMSLRQTDSETSIAAARSMTSRSAGSGPSGGLPQAAWPIFLHSGYRSGSTWFWNRFRECAGAYGYCEPFNVKLATLNAAAIRENRPDNWASGHSSAIAPYFQEYAPLLLPDGGVAHYEPRFGIETYYNLNRDQGMERYLATLIGHAQGLARVPVLGFCGSLGRLEWFRRFATGWNVVTWRNPRDQWCSCHEQWRLHGNANFEIHYLLVAFIARLYPRIAPLFEDLGPLPSPSDLASSETPVEAAGSVADRFRAFLRVFTVDMLLAIECADMVVDLDLLSASPAYRDQATQQLRLLSGLADLAFDDCRLPRHAFDGDADYLALLHRELAFLEELAPTPGAAAFAKSLPFLRLRLMRLAAAETGRITT